MAGGGGPAPQLVLAQKAHAGPTKDGANLRPLVDTAHTVSSIGLALADAEFDSELNHTHIRQELGGAQRHSGQTGQTQLACGNAHPLSTAAVSPARSGRNRLLYHQTQTLSPGSRSMPADPASPSSAARPHLQSLPPVARHCVLQDVNRARPVLIELAGVKLFFCRVKIGRADRKANSSWPGWWENRESRGLCGISKRSGKVLPLDFSTERLFLRPFYPQILLQSLFFVVLSFH